MINLIPITKKSLVLAKVRVFLRTIFEQLNQKLQWQHDTVSEQRGKLSQKLSQCCRKLEGKLEVSTVERNIEEIFPNFH